MGENRERLGEMSDDNWSDTDGGKTIGTTGSEQGKIVTDVEHSEGARITLEKECRGVPFAITIGVYGLMFHTHFESDLKNAETYITLTKTNIQNLFDHYRIPEAERTERWQAEHDWMIYELAGMEETKTVAENQKGKRSWWRRFWQG